MKKIIAIAILAITVFSCGSKENSQNVDDLVKTRNQKELQAKRALLQADLAKIDNALASLDVKKEEALVSVQTIKDTVFNHYLEIQGSVDTKENILIQIGRAHV